MAGLIRVYLNNIVKNYNSIRSCIRPEQKICASVKANAYGHGLREVVQCLKGSVDYWGIASLSAAEEILSIDTETPMLCYIHLLGNELRGAIRCGVELCVGSMDYLRYLATCLADEPVYIHFMVETGMGRLGFQEHEITEALDIIQHHPYMELTGICTHFSDPSDAEQREHQYKKFEHFLQIIPNSENYIRHVASSGVFINNAKEDKSAANYDMIRPGLILYGVFPDPSQSLPAGVAKFHQSMQIICHIAALTHFPAGQPISYSSTFVCPKETNIAVVNIGYGDGISTALSNTGVVSVHNKRYPIVGRVCMDMLLIDLGDDTYPLATEVVIFGNDVITTNEQASRAGIPPYVLTTQLTNRPKREYIYP